MGTPPLQTEPPSPGADIMITALSFQTPLDPRDGIITGAEAIHYAMADGKPNRIYFWPGFGRVTMALGGPLVLGGREDTLDGRYEVKCSGPLYVGCLKRMFLKGLPDAYSATDCYFGFDWDRQTPWGGATLYVDGTDGVVNHNFFGADVSEGQYAALVVSGEGNQVYDNYFGLKEDRHTPQAAAPGIGIVVAGKSNRIGDRVNTSNYIYATRTGIVISGYTGTTATADEPQDNRVRANYIGQNNGHLTMEYGVEFEDGANGNFLGGPVEPGLGPNVYTNYTEAGVYIHEGCNNNGLGGNYIGVNQNGEMAWTKAKAGVIIGPNTTGNQVGGSAPAWKNWIAGATQHCVAVLGNATKVEVQGAYIGFGANYDDPPTAGYGIEVTGASDVLIGGRKVSASNNNGNVIALCKKGAIRLEDGSGVTIQGNVIGVPPQDTQKIGNGGPGVMARNCRKVTVGEEPGGTAARLQGKVPSPQYGNFIKACAYGVRFIKVRNSRIRGNLLEANHCGVRIERNSDDITVRDSEVSHSKNVSLGWEPGPADRGIGVSIVPPVGQVTLIDCKVAWNECQGVLISGSAEWAGHQQINLVSNQIIRNGIQGPGGGVELRGAGAARTLLVDNWIGVAPIEGGGGWEPYGNLADGVLLTNGAHDNGVGRNGERPNRICANTGAGVKITGAGHQNYVIDSYVGRSPDLASGSGNAEGIVIEGDAHHNTVQGCLVAGNKVGGIELSGADTKWNTVRACYVGATRAEGGTAFVADGNDGFGVLITAGAHHNQIGQPDATAYSTVISANAGVGVAVSGEANHNTVCRCRIGTSPNGNQALDARQHTWGNQTGVLVSCTEGGTDNTIGGSSADQGNQISNNQECGVRILYKSTGASVAGNLIGTNAAGSKALGNLVGGVRVEGKAQENSIGLGDAATGNVISGNGGPGVTLLSDHSLVLGNLIGTDATGAKALPNVGSGIVITDGSWNQVKGGNVVAGNRGDGVVILRSSGAANDAQGNLVQGNTIGLDRDERHVLPNGAGATGTGVFVGSSAGPTGELASRTSMEDNSIYAEQACIRFAGSDLLDGDPPNGNRALDNRIGHGKLCAPQDGNIGVGIANCRATLIGNQIHGERIGVRVEGDRGWAGVARCIFGRNRGKHIELLSGSWAWLGRYRAGSWDPHDWQQGANSFAGTTSLDLDAYDCDISGTLMAQNNAWAVADPHSKAQTEARIRFPKGDTSKQRVNYSPVALGIIPTGVGGSRGPAAVTWVAAQPTGAGCAIELGFCREGRVTVRVSNIAGRPVRTLWSDRDCRAGANTLLWDARSDSGVMVPDGVYVIQVTVRSADGAQVRALTRVSVHR